MLTIPKRAWFLQTMLFFLLLLHGSFALAQLRDSVSRIQIGTIHKFHSDRLNEERELWVSVPSDFHPELKGQKFPVAIVLDGPDHFYSLVGMLDRFSRTAGNEVCPPMIVVGLVNTNRERDFNVDINKDPFAEVLKSEIIPYIDKHFPTQPFRILIGHSLAGLRTIHTAVFYEDLFKGYIAIDPSLGQRRNAWYESARKQIQQFYPENSSIYIAMAQTMPGRMVQDTASIKSDTTGYSNHMRRIMEFSEMESRRNNVQRSHFHWNYFPEENHQSVTQPAMYEGIKYLFRWFKPTFYNTFFDTTVTPEEAAAMYEKYYSYVSDQLGYVYLPPEDERGLTDYLFYKNQPMKALSIAALNRKYFPESKLSQRNYVDVLWRTRKNVGEVLKSKPVNYVVTLCKNESRKKEPEYNISEDALNTLGYDLMRGEKNKDALAIFKLNTELYPTSANVWDSYSECLLAVNKKEDSINAYMKSLELNPKNENARQMLQQIKGK